MICLYCGKEFEQAAESGRPRKYCSGECCYNADKDNKRIHYTGKREKVCRQCGKELPKNKTRFCSRECNQLYNNIKTGAIHHDQILKKICPVCGKEFETWKSQKLTCSPECSKKKDNSRPYNPEYEHQRYLKAHPGAKTRQERNEERAKQAEIRKAAEAVIKAAAKEKREKKLKKIRAQKAANKDYWLNYNRLHVCENCGQVYQTFYPLSKYCSEKCQKRATKAKRKKIKYDVIIDRGITLEKLAVRDNNICQICGEPVDWNDKTIENGTVICGDRYPSKDHIYPKSKGGVTSWDNLQLAHRGCNSLKRDKVKVML